MKIVKRPTTEVETAIKYNGWNCIDIAGMLGDVHAAPEYLDACCSTHIYYVATSEEGLKPIIPGDTVYRHGDYVGVRPA